MIDLSPLLTLLYGLGPWGILVGSVLTVIVQRLASRNPQPAPAPGPNPSPLPLPAPDSKTPLLDALLNLMKMRLLKKVAPAAKVQAEAVEADLPDEVVEKILKMLSEKN